MTYQLNIEISSDGLKKLAAADQNVTIVKSMPKGAQVAWISFRPMLANQFDNGQPELPVQSFGVNNSDSALSIDGVLMATCGLYQDANVNGGTAAGAINAVAVKYQHEAVFTPIEKIQIFTSSLQDNGIVISSVTSAALAVALTEDQPQTLLYNVATSRFIPD